MRVTIGSRLLVEGADEQQQATLLARCTHDNPVRAELPRLEADLERRPNDFQLRARVRTLRAEPKAIQTATTAGGVVSVPRGVAVDLLQLPVATRAFRLTRRAQVAGWTDARSDGDPALYDKLRAAPLRLRDEIQMRPYQSRNIERMVTDEQGILRSACGSGKTMTFLMLAVRLGVPVLVGVWSKPLLEQWVASAIRDLGLRADDVGVLNADVERVRPITIAQVQTCVARGWADKYARTFGALLCDEADGYAADSRMRFVAPSEARYRFAASDDERRADEHEFLLYDLFGPVVDVTTRIEAEATGAIVPVRARLVETGYAPPSWWLKLPPSARGVHKQRLLKDMAANAERARLLADLAARCVEAGHQVLAFVERQDHALRVEADLRARMPALGEDAIRRHLGGNQYEAQARSARTGLAEGTTRAVAATYGSLGKGINLPSVARAVFGTSIHNSPDRMNQTLGRLNRAERGKSGGEAVVLYDEQVNGLAPVRAYMKGRREVVVQTRDGRLLTAREYLDEAEDKREQDSPSDFFATLGPQRSVA